MAKLFAIRLGVEPEAVGATIIALKKMRGVLKIDFDLDNEATPKKPNGAHAGAKPRVSLETSGQEDISSLLYAKSPLTTAQLRDAFVAKGRAAKSINSALHMALKAGEVKRADNGEGWVLTKRMRDVLRSRRGRK